MLAFQRDNSSAVWSCQRSRKMDFTRVIKFLKDRNLENLNEHFLVNKIDDKVAPNLTRPQLESLGLVMGDALAFIAEFAGTSSLPGQQSPSTYTERLNELKSKLKMKHPQLLSGAGGNSLLDSDRFYNVTIALKTREKEKFVRKAKKSIDLYVSGETLFTAILVMARKDFKVNKLTDCYLASSSGEILSKPGRKLVTYVIKNKHSKKAPHIYMHYMNSYSHFCWHGEVLSFLDEGDDEQQTEQIEQTELESYMQQPQVICTLVCQNTPVPGSHSTQW